MDRHSGSGSEPLEDQLRRMILSNAPHRSAGSVNPAPQPVVRLPPAGGQYAPNQFTGHPQQLYSSSNMTGSFAPATSLPSQSPHVNPRFAATGPRDQWPPTTSNQDQPSQHFGRGRGQRDYTQNYQQPYRGRGNHAGSQPNHWPAYSAQRARHQQTLPLDPNAFQRNGSDPRPHPQHGPRRLFDPNQRGPPAYHRGGEQHARQADYLQSLAAEQIQDVEMPQEEHDSKEAFRMTLQSILQEVCATDPQRYAEVSLECFGSFRSGFATKGSDMDLAIVFKGDAPASVCVSSMEHDLPRLLEKRLLDEGHGARLLGKTRVPIIKVCEKPSEDLYKKLREERENWDSLSVEEKYPHLFRDENDEKPQEVPEEPVEASHKTQGALNTLTLPASQHQTDTVAMLPQVTEHQGIVGGETPGEGEAPNTTSAQQNIKREPQKPWTRERKAGPLDFPKDGVGIQCDINFFNPLGLHNTQMLRCYSLCDPRVRPMVLFVKAWAKRRKINSSYSGTLSSYGYVLMVLHYLVNIVRPPVLPNLQSAWRPKGNYAPASTTVDEVDGWVVSFWRNEEEIQYAAQHGELTMNTEPIGSLLAGFFQYYSSQGGNLQFRWMQEVLSLRSTRGLLTKVEKGWVKAVTEESEGRKVQQRYLFCIEDPFELSHNVARTVTHNGIVAIRDEFRRANRILHAIGLGYAPRDGGVFDELIETEVPRTNQAEGAAQVTTLDGATVEVSQDRRTNTSSPAARGRPMRHNGQQRDPSNAAKQFNVNDDGAFPSLGTPSPKPSHKKGASNHRSTKSQQRQANDDWGEISGDSAKAVLEEVRRKRDEAQAESTAMASVEAVLGDFD